MPDEKKSESPYAIYAIYGAAGIQFAVAVVAGMVFGNYLDRKIGCLPWLTAGGIVLGFIGGLVNLVRILRWRGRGKTNEAQQTRR